MALKDVFLFFVKNIVIRSINEGNFPLHGINELVRIAINLSRLDDIILLAVTPTELHPKPIQVVRDCFAHEPHFLKALSKLNAILGRYPISSKRVKSGKNIVIGGSITATTHRGTRKIPSVIKYCMLLFIPTAEKVFTSHCSPFENSKLSHSEI